MSTLNENLLNKQLNEKLGEIREKEKEIRLLKRAMRGLPEGSQDSVDAQEDIDEEEKVLAVLKQQHDDIKQRLLQLQERTSMLLDPPTPPPPSNRPTQAAAAEEADPWEQYDRVHGRLHPNNQVL